MKVNPTKDSGLIVAMYAGSHLYGTSRPESDIDIRGVCFPPPNAVLGSAKFEQFSPSGQAAIDYSNENFGIESDDVQIYGLQKFFALCLNANPNIIELLFAPEEAIIFKTPQWDEIVACRNFFLSTRIVHTFSGYAYSQLKRIQRHKKWLDDAPTKPNPQDYGAVFIEGAWRWKSPSKDQIVTLYEITMSYDEFVRELTNLYIAANMREQYEAARKEWKSYSTWLANRNTARALLEKEYGYDTKHAMHLYRLIAEAEELLKTGQLNLPLCDWVKRRLFRIRDGDVSYEDIVRFAEESHDLLEEFANESMLAKNPDRKGAERLLMGMMEKWIYTNLGSNTLE